MNRLANQTSPYLLQPAHNPVNWYAWGDEALEVAQQTNKPLLISIGYAACHWCHVMERECFENEQIAAIMNEYFVCIKIDREERPDLDQIYMDAVQAITGSGGWPLNCFATPQGLPFYGGTYFPPTPRWGKPDWPSVLLHMHNAWQNQNEVVLQQANQIAAHITTDTALKINSNEANNLPSSAHYEYNNEVKNAQTNQKIAANIARQFDTQAGGFGSAPKFPSTMAINWLQLYYMTTLRESLLQHASFSLQAMSSGGICDHLGGGFARYAVDKYWIVPHFEKMLYDNALLINVLIQDYLITKNELMLQVAEQTFSFMQRDLGGTENAAFFASIDADSEGQEGKFYVWQKNEIEAILGQDKAQIYCQCYNITKQGNWEGTNILHLTQSWEQLAKQTQTTQTHLQTLIKQCNQQLWLHRAQRAHPALDDKIILAWNALAISATAALAAATNNNYYHKQLQRQIAFVLQVFKKQPINQWQLYHVYTKGQAAYCAFLDDYALLIAALIDAYQVLFDIELLENAKALTEHVLQNFADQNTGSPLLFYTPIYQTDAVLRKKEIYDGATPSGNSTMALNLLRMSFFTGNISWRQQSLQMVQAVEAAIIEHPASFGQWATVLLQHTTTIFEIVVSGPNALTLAAEINTLYLPNKIMMVNNSQYKDEETRINNSPESKLKKSGKITETQNWPLLDGRYHPEETHIYVCHNYACQMPVADIYAFKKQINYSL